MIDLYDGFAGTISAPVEGPAITGSPAVKAAGARQAFHGTLGDPGYHALHPGNRGKGKRQRAQGGWLGSPDFTEEEHIAGLESYVDDARPLNVPLRTGEGGDKDQETRALNDLIDIQDPLTEPVTVQRGGSALPDMQVGDEFTDRGFVSMTEDEQIANLFAMGPMMRGEGMGHILNITVPAGHRVLEVDKVWAHGNEGEYILSPGSTFRVTGVNDNGYDVEVVPHG